MVLMKSKTLLFISNARPGIDVVCKIRMADIKMLRETTTARKVWKYGVFSGPYFPVFGLNTEIFVVNLRIQSEYRKIWIRNNSVVRNFSRCEQSSIM